MENRPLDLHKLLPLERVARILVATMPVATMVAEALNGRPLPAVWFVALSLAAAYPLISGIAGRGFLLAALARLQGRPTRVSLPAGEESPAEFKRAA